MVRPKRPWSRAAVIPSLNRIPPGSAEHARQESHCTHRVQTGRTDSGLRRSRWFIAAIVFAALVITVVQLLLVIRDPG